jgi:hypothetical protein
MELQIRKVVTIVEEVLNDGSRDLAAPLRLVAAAAVIKNPFAGKYQEDLSLLATSYSPRLAERLVPLASRILAAKATVFGKAAIVGEAGEVQHGSTLLHTRDFGDALRNASKGNAVVPSAEKRANNGATIDVSLRNSEDAGGLAGTDPAALFSWELRFSDAPRADEIVVIAALGDGVRPNSRLTSGR